MVYRLPTKLRITNGSITNEGEVTMVYRLLTPDYIDEWHRPIRNSQTRN